MCNRLKIMGMTASNRAEMQQLYIIGPGREKQEIPSGIVLGKNQECDIVVIVLPGISTDISLNVTLEGEGASVKLSGIYLCCSDERVNISVDLNHKAGHCTSTQLFKGIVGGHARTGFHGKIVVAQDAQKTEAYQANHNLLLSTEARADSEPQLEIYADDVKCSHGATVGRLNEEEQFYMRSRGISLEKARMLQIISFLAPVISEIRDEREREEISELVELALANVLD